MSEEATFQGPLFIVGLPRSGTKLLRALLTNHPRIFAPPAETDFLPYWNRHWQRFGRLSDRRCFRAFYASAVRAPYFVYMREAGRLIDCEKWFDLCADHSAASVFEALVRHDSGCGANPRAIWSDKSPSYLLQVRLLTSLFPAARFIHIVRDVRDYCVSINRAWGKNMLRAAQRWSDSLRTFQDDVSQTGATCHTLRYEDLLENPQRELVRACAFIGVSFVPEMHSLRESPENLGDTKGRKCVVSSNRDKYAATLSDSQTRSIERIAISGLRANGYTCPPASEVRLPSWRLRAYQLADGANLLRFEVGERGLSALSFRWRAFLESGNRFDG